MRLLYLILLSLITLVSYSQDLIILQNGKQIDCKITKIEDAIIHYYFFKGDRKLSSYIAKNKIYSYQFGATKNISENPENKHEVPNNKVIVNTSKYERETQKWVNLITYSQRFGLNADGWSVQYYGYNLMSKSRWSIPILFGVEAFEIHPDYFSRSNYYSVNMSYFLVGISPFYKLNEVFFFNLGAHVVFGEEELVSYYGAESSNSFYGLSPSQGIYFIPKSKVGLTVGVSVYEKILSSEVYKNDLGIKLEVGLKF